MRPRSFTLGPLVAASANNIATSQTPTSSVTLNGSLVSGGVAILDTPRRVRVTTGGSEAGKTMTLTGTTFGGPSAGSIVTDVLTLPGSATTVDSAIDFKTITSAVISSAASNALTIGTNGTAGSAWFQPDPSLSGNVSIQVTVSGTVNYTVQQTMDDPNTPGTTLLPYQMTWVSSADTAVVSATATKQSNYLFLPAYSRVFLNSQTNPGYVVITYIQASGGVT